MAYAYRLRRLVFGRAALSWRLRTFFHDPRDINCVYWTSSARPGGACDPCQKTGGYAEKRRREVEAETAAWRARQELAVSSR